MGQHDWTVDFCLQWSHCYVDAENWKSRPTPDISAMEMTHLRGNKRRCHRWTVPQQNTKSTRRDGLVASGSRVPETWALLREYAPPCPSTTLNLDGAVGVVGGLVHGSRGALALVDGCRGAVSVSVSVCVLSVRVCEALLAFSTGLALSMQALHHVIFAGRSRCVWVWGLGSGLRPRL